MEFAAKEKLEIVLSAPVPAYRSGKQGEAGGRGGLGGIPPADLPAEVSTQAGPSQFRSDIFKQTPPSPAEASMKSKLIIIAIIILVALFILTGLTFALRRQQAIAQINSFAACAQAGYPIMESYPPQCRTPDNRTFTQPISPTPSLQPSPSDEICQNLCGDGTCQEIVCLGSACPCPESPTTCPSDCR